MLNLQRLEGRGGLARGCVRVWGKKKKGKENVVFIFETLWRHRPRSQKQLQKKSTLHPAVAGTGGATTVCGTAGLVVAGGVVAAGLGVAGGAVVAGGVVGAGCCAACVGAGVEAAGL